ncbi:GH36-type glycosyl hydrolase domain-containing protein [Butyrivibrio sp. JL13D10]|uniref:GH36-type glycosyl hydrolase domain-containing protein n=1 Tax=Butyrivibrio sp. JL13D10 TaxID=3236815 RepID=UPI0038B6A69C
MSEIKFIDRNGTFQIENADLYNNLYFPIASEYGLKSCVTPTLSGDSKTDQNHFLFEPMSIENLNNNRLTRNLWCIIDGQKIWSASGNSANQNAKRFLDSKETCKVTAGFMWHRITRENNEFDIQSEITSFVPYDLNTEVHIIRLCNSGESSKEISFIPAFPIYGRSADNIRDHRHVTSLLLRAFVSKRGVIDRPTLSFDERGHQLADSMYYVEGYDENGENPFEFYPVLDDFIGRGTPDWPEIVNNAVVIGNEIIDDGNKAIAPGTESVDGQEIIGAFKFKPFTLQKGESKTFVIYAGISKNDDEYARHTAQINTLEKVKESFEKTRNYWLSKVNIRILTGDSDFDNYMRWVAFQPELRRIYGCSFLPHHDYGKGGRGWRDLWQDCLALLLMDPSGVRQMLLGNYCGVRIDGTNATIIGSKTGEFKADRNSITRVWMDHGVWPFITTRLYIDQTGDVELLNEQCRYFSDKQIRRGKGISESFNSADNWLRNNNDQMYEGTVLEHILIQNLTAFWEVGEHNICKLRDADWNDALDMAGDRGESVAFANAYAGNLLGIADLLDSGKLKDSGISICEDLQILLRDDEESYNNIELKEKVLNDYLSNVSESFRGNKVIVDASELACSLRNKGLWIIKNIREKEWIADGENSGWYNSYYDNNGRALDLTIEGKKNMMLTGQVFSIMCGTADETQIHKICKSADRLLYDENSGGYRLNTDFGEVKTDMGRMFGFAYGEKENGAVFSHMAVMFANALYKRGYAKEGYKALNSLYNSSKDFHISQIYPGIPEYFGRGGKGLYSYLTGAASWYLMTVTMNMFGVSGQYGDLTVAPALLKSQFDDKCKCSIEMEYAFRSFKIDICNPKALEYGSYSIKGCRLDGREIDINNECGCATNISIPKACIDQLDSCVRHLIEIELG